MTAVQEAPAAFVDELERAHRAAVLAAEAGLSDAGLGPSRVSGPGVPVLAEAAVSSATPFLRAPLIGRIGAVLRLHATPDGWPGDCPVCATPAPCETVRLLQR